MIIEQVTDVTDSLISALDDLIPQLSTSQRPPSRGDLSLLVSSEASNLLIAKYPDSDGKIVGMVSLIIYRVSTGVRSIVEDVVVHENFRKRGIAQALLEHAIQMAREAGADGISLTSNPSRVEANLLYQKMGFENRHTNPYFFRLK